MAEILLVYPKAGHDMRGVSVSAPMALLTLAASLVGDFSVKILDQRVDDDFETSLEREIAQGPLLVGITSMTGTQIYYALEITRKIKLITPRTPVVWGGMHPTLYPAQTLSKPYIDFVIRGEGEASLRLLAEELREGTGRFETVPALSWKSKGRLVSTPLADPLDLDRSPGLPWQLVEVEEYTSPSQFLFPGVHRLLPFQGSRGCPFKCTFCSEPALTRNYRMMSPEKIVAECMTTVDRFKLDHISFFDEEFFVNRKWATEVAERIDGRFSWWAQTRAADLLKVDLKKMERCGLRVVAPGLESGSDRLLAFMKKSETVSEYLRANEKLKETGIVAQYNFIIGYPTETTDELDQTVDLVLRLLRENPRATVNQLAPLTPLPGTELLRQVIKDYGFREPAKLEEWIQVTRGKQERPWLTRAQVRRIRFLYFTSYFLCSAERYSQKFFIPKWVFQLYSKSVHFRWRRKWYWLDWEIPMVRLIFRWFVNPIDYALGADFEDEHTQKETEMETIPLYARAASHGMPVAAN